MLIQRILSAVLMILPFIVGLIFAPDPWAGVLALLLFLVAAWEWSGFVSGISSASRWAVFALYAVLMMGLAVLALWLPEQFKTISYALIVGGALWWLAATVNVLRYPFKPSSAFIIIAGLLVLLPPLAVLLHDDLLAIAPRSHTLIFVFALVWAADIGAYIAGRTLGRRKLAPAVSPGKTWEGLFGGLLLAAVVAGVAASKLSLWMLLPISLIVIISSVVGDLTVSLFKRSASVKDSGKLFPGHGGVLDRFDSFAAAAPVLIALMWLASEYQII